MILLKMVFFIGTITICLSLMFGTYIYEYFFPDKSIDPEVAEECETALFSETEPKINYNPVTDE